MQDNQPQSFVVSVKEKIKKFSQVIFALSVLAGTGYCFYAALALIWQSLVKVNPTLAVGVVASVSTITVSIVSLIFSKYFERKSEIRNEHRQKKDTSV